MPNRDKVAHVILEVIPPAMQQIRLEMRAVMEGQLTVPQFRILAAVYRGINRVSDIAEEHGVSPPAMSKMVDLLVRRGDIERAAHPQDRRQSILKLTQQGSSCFEMTRASAKSNIEEKLSKISAQEMENLLQGLSVLQTLFPRGKKRGSG